MPIAPDLPRTANYRLPRASADAPTPYAAFLTLLDDLPTLICHERRRRQLTLREAGADLGISASTLRRWEANQMPLDDLRAVIVWICSSHTSPETKPKTRKTARIK